MLQFTAAGLPLSSAENVIDCPADKDVESGINERAAAPEGEPEPDGDPDRESEPEPARETASVGAAALGINEMTAVAA